VVIVAQVLHPDTSSYDFRVYYEAAQALARGNDPYEYALHCCQGVFGTPGGYTYPPLLAELMRPLGAISIEAATRAWLIVSQACLAAAIYLVWRLLRNRVTATTLAVLLVATLLFRPLHVSDDLRQVNLPLLLLLALAAYSFARSERALWAGAAIALGAMIKLLPVVLLTALVRARGRPRVLPGMAVAAATGALGLAFMWFTSPYTVLYFTRLVPRLAAGSAVYLNQSLYGVSLRAQVFFLGAPRAELRLATSAVAVAALAATWWLGRAREDEVGRLALFAALLAMVPIISTITWDHHLVTEMLVLGLVAPSLPPRSRRWWMAVAAYPLLWLPDSVWVLALAAIHAPRPLVVMLGGSVPALGTILLWAACCLSLRHGDRPDAGRPPAAPLQRGYSARPQPPPGPAAPVGGPAPGQG
jgi:hypothetical protein